MLMLRVFALRVLVGMGSLQVLAQILWLAIQAHLARSVQMDTTYPMAPVKPVHWGQTA